MDSILAFESAKLHVTMQTNLMANRKTAEQLNCLDGFFKDMHNENHVRDVRNLPVEGKIMPKQQQRCDATLNGEMQKHARRKHSRSEMHHTTHRRCCKRCSPETNAAKFRCERCGERCGTDKMRYNSGRLQNMWQRRGERFGSGWSGRSASQNRVCGNCGRILMRMTHLVRFFFSRHWLY